MNKRNRLVIILSVILFVGAIAFLILGFALSGADILAWFGSKWAIWLYVFAGAYLLLILGIFVTERIKNL